MMMRKKRLRLLQSGKSTQPLISKKCLRKKAYKGILESAQISMEDVKVTFEVVASSFLACNFPGFIRKHWKIRWGRGPYEQGGKIESTYCQNFAKCTVHLDVACLNQISCPQTSGMESHILPFNVAKCRGVTQSFNGKFNINTSCNVRIKVIEKVSLSDRLLSFMFEYGSLFLTREDYYRSHRELFKEM